MSNLFAYGTLMCEDIMQEVAGCLPPHEPGTLKRYSRRCVKGENFPAIVPDQAGRVAGIVYKNVSDLSWERLDRFEGDFYARRLVQVELNDGTTFSADAYVVKPQFVDRLTPTEWDFEDFLQKGKDNFQKRYRGYWTL